MIGIDTNILLAYFIKDDASQFARAREILEDQLSAKDPGFVTLIGTIELVWALKHVYKYPADKIVILLKALLEADELEIERADLVAEAIEHALDNQIELAEALIVPGSTSRELVEVERADVDRAALFQRHDAARGASGHLA